MKNHKISLKNYILIALVITLPILFGFYSPVLLIWGIRNGVIKVSVIIFAAWIILSLFWADQHHVANNAPWKKFNGS